MRQPPSSVTTAPLILFLLQVRITDAHSAIIFSSSFFSFFAIFFSFSFFFLARVYRIKLLGCMLKASTCMHSYIDGACRRFSKTYMMGVIYTFGENQLQLYVMSQLIADDELSYFIWQNILHEDLLFLHYIVYHSALTRLPECHSIWLDPRGLPSCDGANHDRRSGGARSVLPV